MIKAPERIKEIVETNPIMLRLYKLGWEPPADQWRTPAGQILAALTLHEVAGNLADEGMRERVREVSQRIIVANAESLGR